MPSFVVDTSVVVKWFNQKDELQVDKALQIFDGLTEHRLNIIVPDLIIIELLNVFLKSKTLTVDKIKEDISDFLSLPLIIKQPTQSVLELAIEIANRHKLTIYDALFIALAQVENCQLISDDKKGHGIIKDGSVLMLKDY